MDERLGAYSEYTSWRKKLDDYLTDKKRRINKSNAKNKTELLGYTEWAVNELTNRLIDICSDNFTAFDIVEEFLWEVVEYRVKYGKQKENKKVELIFDVAATVAQEVAVLYCFGKEY